MGAGCRSTNAEGRDLLMQCQIISRPEDAARVEAVGWTASAD
jgi:hypothetical protein